MIQEGIRHLCRVESRRVVWLIGIMFACVILVQYFELPYGNVITSIFSASNSHDVDLTQVDLSSHGKVLGNGTQPTGLNSTHKDIFHGTSNITKTPGNSNDLGVSDESKGSDDKYPEDESPSKDAKELSDTSNGDRNVTNNGLAPEAAREPTHNFTSGKNSSLEGKSLDEPSVSGAPSVSLPPVVSPPLLDNQQKNPSVGATPADPTVSLPPVVSPPNLKIKSSPENASSEATPEASSVALPPLLSPKVNATPDVNPDSQSSVAPNTTLFGTNIGNEAPNSRSSGKNRSSNIIVPTVKEIPKRPTKEVLSISDMNDLLVQSRLSTFSKKPLWPSPVDQDLLNAKLQIANAPKIENDAELLSVLYKNVSKFKRSYELMEQTLKVYIYKEGEKPIWHQPSLKGIYASEGWFMKLLQGNRHYVTNDPSKAHLFYLPFSSRLLEETLYVRDSHSHKNLIEHLKNYLDMIAARHNFWNRTGGADHFLVACHDWAPAETRDYMATNIRALCNSDVKEGFAFGRDVSLPETMVSSAQNLVRDLGGKPPSQRNVLAFFAGKMHGYLRPTLLKYWESDPDMKITGRMRKAKAKGKKKGKIEMDYTQYMKSSKYCVCPKGYEVNSPRVVEAIFYECVPVIISDNFVPPFLEVLDWESFAIFIAEKDIPNLKKILLSIPTKRYIELQRRVKAVQKHFLWHVEPQKYDIFHMILHSIWLNRVSQIQSS